jgi:hypothetical protein
MFFEFRLYRTKPGKREEWVRLMEEEIIPFQASKGMIVVGSFVGEQEEDLYIWVRRFESEEERERLYAAVYDSDYWKDVLSPKVEQLLYRDQIQVIRVEPTTCSVIR